MNKWSGKINKSYPLWIFEPPIRPCWSGPPVMKTGMFSPWDHQKVKRERGKQRKYNCMIGLLINTVQTRARKMVIQRLYRRMLSPTHRFIIIFESKIEIIVLSTCLNIWAETWDFQQCGILTWIDSGEPVPPPFELRNSKCCSVSS